MSIGRRIIWWDFERASWQWDVLCLLIIAFIFLTPKAWFENRERLATRLTKVIVQAPGLTSDAASLESRVKELIGDREARISGIESKRDASGVEYYEITLQESLKND